MAFVSQSFVSQSIISMSVARGYTSQPTETISGSGAVLTGSMYWNINSSSLYIYDGEIFESVWVGNNVTASAVISGSITITGSLCVTGSICADIPQTSNKTDVLVYDTSTDAVGYDRVKYTTTIGDGTSTGFIIPHALSTQDVFVILRDAVTGQIYSPSATAGTPPQYSLVASQSDSLIVSFSSAPSPGAYDVVVRK